MNKFELSKICGNNLKYLQKNINIKLTIQIVNSKIPTKLIKNKDLEWLNKKSIEFAKKS
jgi:hypothetical protein